MSDRETAVGRNRLAGDKGGIIGTKKQRHAGDLLRLGLASQQMRTGGRPLPLPESFGIPGPIALVERRVDAPWTDTICPDSILCVIHRDDLGQRDYSCLGGAIMRQSVGSLQAR